MQDVKISFPIFGSGFVLDPPRYFVVFGRPVYFYAVIIVLGFLLATLYIMRRRREFGLTQDHILDMFIYCVVSGVVGARLYYVIFNPADYFGPGKWLNIVKVWEGGLAIYGGIIAAAVCMFFYARAKKVPVGVFFDVGGLALLIGQAIGRWGNFFNREAFGGQTDLPWKMGLTTGAGTVYVHPTFLYESLWNILGFILIHTFSKKNRKYDGQIFLMYLAWYGFGRFLVEGLRTDSLYLGSTDIRVSQLFAALTFGTASYFLLRNRLRKKYAPGGLFVNRTGSGEKDGAPEKAETPPDDKEIKEEKADPAATGNENKETDAAAIKAADD
jgi:phosphatidylglycerol:prolipoprotein diacylglycerol transferase